MALGLALRMEDGDPAVSADRSEGPVASPAVEAVSEEEGQVATGNRVGPHPWGARADRGSGAGGGATHQCGNRAHDRRAIGSVSRGATSCGPRRSHCSLLTTLLTIETAWLPWGWHAANAVWLVAATMLAYGIGVLARDMASRSFDSLTSRERMHQKVQLRAERAFDPAWHCSHP